MTQGKNPRNFKKKGKAKKVVHAFAKKNWYTIMAPSVFQTRDCCLTPVNKTAGLKKEEDALKGRTFTLSLADLNPDAPEMNWRKMRLEVQMIEGAKCYTAFDGMWMTRDRLCHIVKKWQTTIEAFVDVKTMDGYFLRMFCIGFTQRRKTQLKATCYATGAQRGNIRKKMMKIMMEEAQKSTLKDLTAKFVNRSIEKRIGKEANKVFPLQNVYLTKVKMIKKAPFDLSRLMDMYSDKQGAARVVEETPAEAEPSSLLSNEKE
jgi:small subunit ribosomal protein S3Ae